VPFQILAFVACTLVLSACAWGRSEAGKRPSLRMTSSAPLTLTGARFTPGETVRITVTQPRRSVRTVRANSQGSFTVRFQNVPTAACGTAVSARAVGRYGSEAWAKTPQRECPPSL
jgi:hypothetical protein